MQRITLEQIEELPEREKRQLSGWINHNLRSLCKSRKARAKAMRREELGVEDGQDQSTY